MNSYCSYSFPFESASNSSNYPGAASELIIRPAQITDTHNIAKVLTHSFHVTTGPFFWIYPLIKLGIYEDLRNRLRANSPNYLCLIAVKSINGGREEKIVGTVELSLKSHCILSTFAGKCPYIGNLAVSSAYRRQGIGKKLLLKCEQITLDWGFSKISLHVLANNYRAKKLYFSLGYKLHQVDSNLFAWLFKRPQKLLLTKTL